MTVIYCDRLGEFSIRPVDPAADAQLLHRWVTHPKASFWMMQNASLANVVSEYTRIAANPHHEAFMGMLNGRPSFLMERYDPARVELDGLYDALPGDVGMHLLCPATDTPRHGFTRSVMSAVLSALFADPEVQRVVVEPDLRNHAIHSLNLAVGFRPSHTIETPHKTALLSFCSRADFTPATTEEPETPAMSVYPATLHQAVEHLAPTHWARANRLLLAKALGEFSHERLLQPLARGDVFVVSTDDHSTRYTFKARRLALEHWHVDPDSILCTHADGTTRELDLIQFVLELRSSLELSDEVLPVYLEEISSTLSALAFKLAAPQRSAGELVDADFQTIEAAMLGGHPCFIANSGRIGFGIHEYHAFTPESAQPVTLVWIAAHAEHAHFSSCRDTEYASFMRQELGPQLDEFNERLRSLQLDPDDYLLMPVHPWQWWNKLTITFASEIANQRLVLLGESQDRYTAQQSVRTFFNASQPTKHYVKTAISVINMGFMRGLSSAYMRATPAINDWLADLIANDETLTQTGVSVIRERAAVGYRAPQFEQATDRYSPYRKMLAALWRESPVTSLDPGAQLSTMAALLHVDCQGKSFVGQLISQSEGSARDWLTAYLNAYLVPLLHSFYRYGLAFMPHGENVILVLRNGLVERAIMKDIAEEIVVMSPTTPLPEAAERIRADVPHDLQLLSIFTDVFDCFLRHLSAIMDDEQLCTEGEFWSTVAAVIEDYQRTHPELADRFAEFDIFAEEFSLSCLNRLQLRNNQQMVDLADPAGALQLVGSLRNPIVIHRNAETMAGV